MKNGRFKKGVASFYIVAFAALILVIIASSFVMVVISETNRSSNSDLSRSAYDSAMAGVEDAKLALLNYQSCLAQGYSGNGSLSGGDAVTCEDILYYMNHPDCDMVAHILGRTIENGEVEISESSGSSNNMSQAYTCVMIKTDLSDYEASLSSSNNNSSLNSYKVIKVNLQDPNQINNIMSVRLSWHALNSGGVSYGNFWESQKMVIFKKIDTSGAPTPPTMALQLVQTAERFGLSDLSSKTIDGRTDRATLYLVPTDDSDAASRSSLVSYTGAYKDGSNNITADQFASTNDHEKNVPYLVYCGNNDNNCSVTIGIPKPIGDERRSADTFMFVVSLPYGQPETEFKLELCTDDLCTETAAESAVGGREANRVSLKNMQIMIDSTGKANDLYRRVEVRLEGESSGATYFQYAIQATDNGGGNGAKIEKTLVVGNDN